MVPAGTTCSSGPLSDRTLGFSCLQDSISLSSGEIGRCLAEFFERFLRRRHKYNSPSSAASASAPRVQPRTIASVLLLPPLPLLLEAAFAALGSVDAGLEVGLGVLEGLDVGDADVLEVVLDEEELDDDVEVDSLLEDDAEAVVGARTEVTPAYIDCASDSRELKRSCPTEVLTSININGSLVKAMLCKLRAAAIRFGY